MAAEAPGVAAEAEFGELLDQCTAEELTTILQSIEGGHLLGSSPAAAAGAAPQAAVSAPPEGEVAPRMEPVPPTQPPPAGAGRRPCPAGVKRGMEAASAENGGADTPLTMESLKKMLESHSEGVINEVRRLLPQHSATATGTAAPQLIQAGTLTEAIAEREQEVKVLEARLAALQTELALKDKGVEELGLELDATVREVRHRQLDLEFQQLKLEERVRTNADMEQAQRALTARVEEASLNARHAALDAEMCQSTPRSVRVQGTLPWTLRKNRLPDLPPAAAMLAERTSDVAPAAAAGRLPDVA